MDFTFIQANGWIFGKENYPFIGRGRKKQLRHHTFAIIDKQLHGGAVDEGMQADAP